MFPFLNNIDANNIDVTCITCLPLFTFAMGTIVITLWKFRRHKAVEETLVSTSKENTYLKLKQKQKQKTMSKDKNLAYAGEENPFIYHIVSH